MAETLVDGKPCLRYFSLWGLTGLSECFIVQVMDRTKRSTQS
nr:MAG TPA: hypothetical protein [Caudoviricetes sp.]